MTSFELDPVRTSRMADLQAGPPSVQQLDVNGDGVIDHTNYDLDGDGRVERSEVDENGDGRIDTVYEFATHPGDRAAVFHDYDHDGKFDNVWMDTNADGKIDEIRDDPNEDGNPEKVRKDTDHDGTFDRILYDDNSDGQVDRVGYDSDGDGNPNITLNQQIGLQTRHGAFEDVSFGAGAVSAAAVGAVETVGAAAPLESIGAADSQAFGVAPGSDGEETFGTGEIIGLGEAPDFGQPFVADHDPIGPSDAVAHVETRHTSFDHLDG